MRKELSFLERRLEYFNPMQNLIPEELPQSFLTFKCAKWQIKGTQLIGGVVSFTGTYRDGSAGFSDAFFIQSKTQEFVRFLRPNGLVVSFLQMKYSFGDDLDIPWIQKTGPYRIICSSENIRSIQYIFGEKAFCGNVIDGVDQVTKELRSGLKKGLGRK